MQIIEFSSNVNGYFLFSRADPMILLSLLCASALDRTNLLKKVLT